MSNVKLNDLAVDVLMNSSWTELLTLEQNVKRVMEVRRSSAKIDVMQQLSQISLMNGFTIDELFGQSPVVTQVVNDSPATLVAGESSVTHAKLSVKYRSTENTNDVWTGRGKTPNWLQKLLNSGRKLEEFVV